MLAKKLVEAGAVKIGDFGLTKGGRTHYYVDVKGFLADSRNREIAFEYMSNIVHGNGPVAGLALGGAELAISYATATGRPFVIIRDSERDHGIKDPIIGKIEKGMSVYLLEDTLTTGRSAWRAVEILNQRGVRVFKTVAVMDRQEGAQQLFKSHFHTVVPLATYSELVEIMPELKRE